VAVITYNTFLILSMIGEMCDCDNGWGCVIEMEEKSVMEDENMIYEWAIGREIEAGSGRGHTREGLKWGKGGWVRVDRA